MQREHSHTFETDVAREEDGFSFSMRVEGSLQTLRVYVSDDALEADEIYADEEELREQFEKNRQELEAVASEKFSKGRVCADGVVAVTLADITAFLE